MNYWKQGSSLKYIIRLNIWKTKTVAFILFVVSIKLDSLYLMSIIATVSAKKVLNSSGSLTSLEIILAYSFIFSQYKKSFIMFKKKMWLSLRMMNHGILCFIFLYSLLRNFCLFCTVQQGIFISSCFQVFFFCLSSSHNSFAESFAMQLVWQDFKNFFLIGVW